MKNDDLGKIPSIRFKGFTNAWEQRRLGNLLVKNFKKNFDLAIDNVESVSNKTGFTKQTEQFEDYSVASADLSNYYVISEQQFAYNPSRINVGSIAYKERGKPTSVVSPLYVSFSTNNDLEDGYLWNWFKTEDFERQRKIFSEGGVRDTLSFNQLSEITIDVPGTKEQQQIGSLFNTLDNLITLHQRKLDKTKELKKTMLSKMFPKNGEDKPELRFSGFTDAWEQCDFKDLAKVRRGLTYKPKDVQKKGVRVLRSSNINEDTFELRSDDIFVNQSALNIKSVDENDILITSANGSSRLVGKHALIKNITGLAVHGGFMLLATSEEPYFTNALMSSSWYSRFIHIYVSGGNGAIGNLSKSDLDSQKIYIPKQFEQQQIGSFFNTLDNLITLHHRELEKLKNIKKTLLKYMFV